MTRTSITEQLLALAAHGADTKYQQYLQTVLVDATQRGQGVAIIKEAGLPQAVHASPHVPVGHIVETTLEGWQNLVNRGGLDEPADLPAILPALDWYVSHQ